MTLKHVICSIPNMRQRSELFLSARFEQLFVFIVSSFSVSKIIYQSSSRWSDQIDAYFKLIR